jgi:hypothetical protein
MKMHRLLITLLVPALLAGCGEPLSNRLIEEDILFRTSLPASEDVATSSPEDELDAAGARDLGDRAQLVTTTKAVSSLYNGIVWSLLGVVDAVIETTPSRREEHRRVWGPFAGKKAGTSTILVVRRAEEGLFNYSIDGADVPRWAVGEDTEWVPIMSGSFARGASLREGEGQFVLDAAAWGIIDSRFEDGTGQLAVAHSRSGEGIAIDVVVADWMTARQVELDASYRFRRGVAGGGFFEYETVDEVIGNGGEPENYIIRARWAADRTGRADFLLRGEGLGAGIPGIECWDGELGRTFWSFDPVGTQFDELEGVESDCTVGFEQPGDPAPELESD